MGLVCSLYFLLFAAGYVIWAKIYDITHPKPKGMK